MPFLFNGIYKAQQLNLRLRTGKRLCYTHLKRNDLYYNQKVFFE